MRALSDHRLDVGRAAERSPERHRARGARRGLRVPFRGRVAAMAAPGSGAPARKDRGMTKIQIRYHDVDITDVLRIHVERRLGSGARPVRGSDWQGDRPVLAGRRRRKRRPQALSDRSGPASAARGRRGHRHRSVRRRQSRDRPGRALCRARSRGKTLGGNDERRSLLGAIRGYVLRPAVAVVRFQDGDGARDGAIDVALTMKRRGLRWNPRRWVCATGR